MNHQGPRENKNRVPFRPPGQRRPEGEGIGKSRGREIQARGTAGAEPHEVIDCLTGERTAGTRKAGGVITSRGGKARSHPACWLGEEFGTSASIVMGSR